MLCDADKPGAANATAAARPTVPRNARVNKEHACTRGTKGVRARSHPRARRAKSMPTHYAAALTDPRRIMRSLDLIRMRKSPDNSNKLVDC